MTPTQLRFLLLCSLLSILTAAPASAQSIVPAADGTATVVNLNGQRFTISGGTLSGDGTNLFHSFEQFGLHSSEMAQFLTQPDVRNVLSRVVGGNVSTIDGLIQLSGSNANLLLLNPAGIVFGPNARLDLPASFTATTADRVGLTGGWFNTTGPNDYAALTGNPNRFAFTSPQPGSLLNAGDLRLAPGNHLTLLGGSVVNTGNLSAPGGNITVAAIPGQNLVRISQTGMVLNLEVEPLGEGVDALGSNSIPLRPLSLPELLTTSNFGHATNLTIDDDGTLRLTGSGLALPTAPGSVAISGSLDVSSPRQSSSPLLPPTPQTGGIITILGNQVGLFSATLDASGANGGGTVRVGGDIQGQGTLPQAEQTLVTADSILTADALHQGDGGQVIIWADHLTRFYGQASARGGTHGGDGGFIEASGKELLIFAGNADASAPQGQAGQLLLDPKNITIADRNAPLAILLNPTPVMNDRFGSAVAGVGNNVIVGVPGAMGGTGIAYLFDGSTGELVQTFSNPNPTISDLFGSAVAGLGNNVLVGAPGDSTLGPFFSGAAYLFDSSTGTNLQTFFSPNSTLLGSFGSAVAGVGTNALVGAPGEMGGRGAAYLFDPGNPTTPVTFTSPNSMLSDFFGSAVAGVGNKVLVGSPEDNTAGTSAGATYLFNSSGGLLQTFLNPTPASGDNFGSSVAAVGDKVLIGAFGDSTAGTTAGAAYLFDGNTGGLLQTFLSPNPNPGDEFGVSVAGVGNNVLVGSRFDQTTGVDAGAAYLFSGSTGALQQTFLNPSPVTGDQFGQAVAASGSTALVGANLDDTGAINAGTVYTFPTSFTFDDNPDQSVTIAASTLTNITNGGTSVVLQASNDITVNQAIVTNNPSGNGGDLILQAGRSLLFNAGISTDDGNLTLIANETTMNGAISAFRDPGNAAIAAAPGVSFNTGSGNLTAILSTGAGLANNSSGDIILGNLTAGSVRIENNGPGNGNITTGEIAATVGSAVVATNGDITTTNIATTGGSATLLAGDSIVTSDITTGGGNITLAAGGEIIAGKLDSSNNPGNGGNTTLNAVGDIQLGAVNAQGGMGGMGGSVEITSNSFIRVTDVFTDRNGILASISSAGGLGGGEITIQHGGNGIIPFSVGDASLNGTAAAITSGDFTIEPLRIFPFTHVEGNIQIISIDEPFEPTSVLDPRRLPDLLPIYTAKPLISSELDTLPELDERFVDEFSSHLEIDKPPIVTLADARKTLRRIEQATGVKPAIIYAFFRPQGIPPETITTGTKSLMSFSKALPDQWWQFREEELVSSRGTSIANANFPMQDSDPLELVLVTAEGEVVRRIVVGTTRETVLKGVEALIAEVTDRRKLEISTYLGPAEQMYQWLVAPLEEDLQVREIDNLVFILDRGLRSVPLAAMHDGQNFIIERYSVGLMPSLSLTDTRYVDVRNLQVLAMGAEEFQKQIPLIAVPAELSIVTERLWQGQSFINHAFTSRQLKAARKARPFGILHLATHANFRPGKVDNSYIQFWQDEQISLKEVRQLALNDPPVELLVLSACRTALGNAEVELGFAGLAVLAGVKSAMGSLWYVSDEGTLGLMTSFYEQLRIAPIKAEALRQAQLSLSRGEVRLEAGELVTSEDRFPLPRSLAGIGDRHFTHPYYWSGFTMIGNPW